MTVSLNFYGGPTLIDDLSGSGLAFFGDSGFGASITVGSYNGRTYISNGAGSTQGAECPNVKYLNSASGILGQSGSGNALTTIPNFQATLRIDLVSTTPVRTQNAELRIYDRVSTNNPASGVTAKVAEIIHPGNTQANTGSGDTTWYTPTGSSVVVPFAPSPGPSGLYAGNGSNGNWQDGLHSWFAAISCSPDSIGSKSNFGLSFSVEYL